MTPPPLSRGKGGSSDDGHEFAAAKVSQTTTPTTAKFASHRRPKISEDAAVSSEKNSREMYDAVMPQFALNSPMEASISPPETILKAELMEEFLTNANNKITTMTTDDEQKQRFTRHRRKRKKSNSNNNNNKIKVRNAPITTSNTWQNSSDNSDDDTSYHGRRKIFSLVKTTGMR